jgi:hypothetical protein
MKRRSSELMIDDAYASLAEVEPHERGATPIITLGNIAAGHYAENLKLDLPAAEALAERRLKRQVSLGSMTLALYDSSKGPMIFNGEPSKSSSFIVFARSKVEGQYYSPLVVLDVHGKPLETLNADLRHELGHLGDKAETPFYNKRGVHPGFRTLATLGASTGMAATIVGTGAGLALAALNRNSDPSAMLHAQEMMLNGMAWTQIGSTLRRHSGPILHDLTPTERRAEKFARQNADLNPLYIEE